MNLWHRITKRDKEEDQQSEDFREEVLEKTNVAIQRLEVVTTKLETVANQIETQLQERDEARRRRSS